MNLPELSINRVITAPKNLTSASIIVFILQCEKVFELKGKNEKGFLLDLSKIQKASMLGILVIYKLIEFTFTHGCFVNPMISFDQPIRDALKKYGFSALILSYIVDKRQSESEYKKLKVSVGDNFIIAPQALLRNDKISRESLSKNYLPQIQEYYKEKEKVVSMILIIFSEVLLNFWEHAVDDTKSIIVANGNHQNIEIACADTGDGIISTLGKSLNTSLSPQQILEKSVEKGMTSKQMTNHMGYGLWILDEIVNMTKGRMHIYSQGYYYYNEMSKKRSGKCGYWQGTIIYLSIPLIKPVTLSDIKELQNTGNDLKINWG